VVDEDDQAFGEVGHDGGGVAGEAEKFFRLGSDGFEGGSSREVSGHGREDVAAMERGGGFPGQEEILILDEMGVGEAFPGEDLGEEAVVRGQVNPAGGRADGQGGAARADPWIHHGDDNGAGGQGAGGFGQQVGGGGDIEDGAVVGKVEQLGGGVDGFHRALELADIRVVDSEIGVKGDQVGHLEVRLASGQPGGKQGEEPKGGPHDYLDSGGWEESISSQNFGLPASSSSSARGSWERKAKSLREFLWRTRWMTRPVVFCSK